MIEGFFKGYGFFKKAVSLFFFLLAFAPCIGAFGAPPAGSYLEGLLRLAGERGLHASRRWEVLLHYKPTLFGVESLVDDPKFFLSPEGKTDPGAELNATIEAFFAGSPLDGSHPRCRFPARYAWLERELHIDSSRLPGVECVDLRETLAKINPRSAVLVFSDAHINSPASMFGHTLVRIDSERESRLMSYAANYSALATDTQGFIYAFKGLFGYYKGFFTILPYYEKVKEYNDSDQRDMWEYHLNFTREEVERMIMHLWELQGIYSHYYFFDENCSYTLLFLLENARPSLRLTDGFVLSATPVDTIRAVRAAGAVEDVVYRPSMSTRMRRLASLLDGDARELASDIAHRRSAPETAIEKGGDTGEAIAILDLAAEHIQYRYAKDELTKDGYRKLFLDTLKARGSLGRQSAGLYEFTPPPVPDGGHLSRRLSAAGGFNGGRWFEELQFRPAYHRLLDPMDGYIEGSQIEFFETTVRHYPDKNRLILERVDIIDILSLTPRDRFFKPVSWKGLAGAQQRLFPDGKDHLVFRLNTGAGYVYRHPLGIYYAMAEGDLLASSRLDDSFSLGVGATAGVTGDLAAWWKTHLFTRALFYELGDGHRSYEAVLEQSFKVNTNTTFSLDLGVQETFGVYRNDARLAFNIFF